MTQLERFITKGEVEITPHPITNERRLAKLLQGFHWLPYHQSINMACTIIYIDGEGNPRNLKSLAPYEKVLSADGVTKVTVQGEIIPYPGGISPMPVIIDDVVTNQSDIDIFEAETANYNAATSEYQFFINIANNDVNIFQVMLNTILLRASQGKFDI